MPKTFTHSRSVQFCETDMAGVMHFANYFRFMEEAEHAFWRSLGESVHTRRGDTLISWPRAAASCDFLAPLRFEDEVTLHVTLAELGPKSVTLEFEFESAGRLVARGRTRAVCCRIEGGQFESLPIPADLRDKLRPYAVTEA
jgi:4-hydroxybenzoyl-CoA thioesterase/acyl-CoA thioester hydrolase